MIYIFYLTLFMFIFGHGLYYAEIDYDLFARLIVGKTFFQTGTVMNWDFLSFSETHRFVDHEWGSSLVFYFLQSNFGDIGLFIFKAVIYFLAFFFLSRVILLHNKNAKMHMLFFLCSINAIPGILFSTIRCQIFTFFFFALWLYVLERVRIKNENRLLWILPATMLIWGNLHGGCFAGYGLLVMYIIGEFLNKKPVKKYIYTLAASIAILLINPYGFEYLKFLLYATTMKREFITEWQPTLSPYGISTNFRFLVFMGLFIVFWFTYFIKRYICEYNKDKKPFANLVQLYKNADKTKLVVLAFTMLMAIKAIRLQAFLVIAVVAFFYNDFYYVFSKKLPKILDNAKEIILFLLMIVFVTSSAHFLALKGYLFGYPVAEVEFIKINKLKGNLLCEFHHGSYAAYKLYPDNLIFMDGKYEEVYPSEHIYFLDRLNVAPKNNWKEQLLNSAAQLIIVSKKYNVFPALKNDKDFVQIMESRNYALFIKRGLVKNYNFKKPSSDIEHYSKTKYETNINWR